MKAWSLSFAIGLYTFKDDFVVSGSCSTSVKSIFGFGEDLSSNVSINISKYIHCSCCSIYYTVQYFTVAYMIFKRSLAITIVK